MKYLTRLIIVLFLLLPEIGCATDSSITLRTLSENFAKNYSITNMNETLQVELESETYTFQADNDIPIFLYNRSDQYIRIDNNAHIKMFLVNGDEWIEIDNALTYSGEILLSPQGTPLLDFRASLVQPVISREEMSTISDDVLVRVFVIGEIIEHGQATGEFVGAYIDVFVSKL